MHLGIIKITYVTPPTRVRTSEVYTQPLLAYIRYTHPPKPYSHPGHGTNVTPPDMGPHQLTERVANPGLRQREAGTLTRNAKGYSL